MLHFSKYTQLNEAAFSLSSIFMVVRKIEKVLARRLGRIYRYDGDNGYQELQNSRGKAIGFLYFLANGRAFQLNYMKPKGESRAVFATVNIWRKYKTDKEADFTIKLNGLNIVQVINTICDIIKNPAPGEVSVTLAENVDNELEELNEMARRRVDLSTFAQMSLKLYGRVSDLTWQEVQNTADVNNVQIPTVVRGMKSGRGRWHLVPQSAGQPHEGDPADHDPDVGTDPETGLAKKSSLVVIGKGPDGRWFKPKEEEVVKALNFEVKKMLGGGPTQAEIKDPNTLFGHMVKLVQMVARGTNPSLLIYGGPGTGKAQPLDCMIKIPGGWKRMGDMKFLDEIITPNGTIAKVTGIFPQGKTDVYEVIFEDGRKTRASGEHLWKVINTSRNRERVYTTEQITKLAYKNDRFCVPLVECEEKEDVDLPIDPYVMGILLGDGCFRTPRAYHCFSTADVEVIQNIEMRLNEGYAIKKASGGRYDYGIRQSTYVKGGHYINNAIKLLNLDMKMSHEKFIPDVYKNASKQQRLDLIRGLLDSDGSVENGSPWFYTTSEKLKDDFVELVRSVGGIAFSYLKTNIFYEYKGVKKQGKDCWSVRIRYHDPKSLFLLERKRNKISDNHQYKNCLLRFKDIRKLPEQEETQCISVSDPNHLYITDDYIVTHNTFTVLDTLQKEGLSKNSGFHIVKGKTSPMGLYRILFQLRHDLIVFDDSDSVFATEDSRNILKAALDSYDTRLVSWQSSQTIPVNTMGDAEREAFNADIDTKLSSGEEKIKLPSEFEFTGKVIFISNLPADKIEPAILSRSFKIDMTITPDAIFNRIESIIDEVGDKTLDVDSKKEILNHLRKMHALGNLESPNMRTFVAACAIKKSGVPGWEELIAYT